MDPTRVVAGGITHGAQVVVAGEQEAGEYILDTDALITNAPNLFLTVTAADCMPVFYFDPTNHSIGIAHAGWRGLVAGALENVVHAMEHTYGSKAKDLEVVIRPHIGPCHYDVGAEVAAQFDQRSIERRDGRLFARLAHEAEGRLHNAGIRQVSIEPICTYCAAERFYSARHDKPEPLQGMVAYIGFRN